MNVKEVLKITFLFVLITGSVVLFQYLGTNKMDFFLIGLVSVLISLVVFLFYESALRNNKRLFAVLASLTVIYFSLFTYKKMAIVEDKKVVSKLIEVTKNLRTERYNLEKLIIKNNNKKKDEPVKNEERTKEINNHNLKINSAIDYVLSLYNDNVKLLSEIRFKSISKVTKIKIEKYISKYHNEEDIIKKNYNELKKENTELKEKIKDDKKREEEAKKKEEELKKIQKESVAKKTDTKKTNTKNSKKSKKK